MTRATTATTTVAFVLILIFFVSYVSAILYTHEYDLLSVVQYVYVRLATILWSLA